ncbi:gastrula zinc finger protein XlCGF26.1-like [Lampris incognitus]|uniref:gastrula zinc finger protein XlCGF26.1-like n=1 Tax=Lampris incognitus TaxID=2546036 RepID=UPI0024B59D2A|nr:gastrula zinc finger protein XlCGF26.1-like [Lampris incognitus]
MSRTNLLSSFVVERLTAAAEEILGAFERTIEEYEDERHRQRRLLDMVLKPRITLRRIDFIQLSDQQHGGQERSLSLAKEEQQEFWISLQEDQLQLQQVADTSESIFTPLCDGNDDGKDQPLPSQHYQTKTEGDTEPPAVTSFELIQVDVKEDNFLISEPTSDDHTLSNCCHGTKSEAANTWSCQNYYVQLSDQQHQEQERSPSLAKEEQQELWISPQEDQLLLQELADTSESIFTALCHGNYHGKDQPLPSQCYQTKTEGDTEPPAVTSFELIQMDVKEDNFLISEPTSDHHALSNCCHGTKSEADHTWSRQNCEEVDSVRKARLKPHKKLSNKCTICGKVLYNLEIFKIHMRFHTGERPFKFTTCGRDFTWKYNMEGHTRTHTGAKPLRCTTCGKMFTHKSSFQTHLRTHTGEKPFRCTTCEKMFTHKPHLLRHVRTHTGEKPFTCTTCGKMFTRKSGLQMHLRTHTGEKPFRCTTCGKVFTRKSNLQTHLRTHTGENPF